MPHPWNNFMPSVAKTRRSALLLCLVSALTLCAAGQDVHVQVSSTSKGNTSSKTDFPTIQMAMDHAPDPGPGGRLYLHIAPGTYRERVWISPLRPRTTFLGTGSDPSQVVIMAGQSAKMAGGTFFTETVQVLGDDFEADNVTFQNDAGPVGQAVALAVNADKAVFKHCRFVGDQDTLFANAGRQFYTESTIIGGVDFIFGNAAAVFENSELHILRAGYLTAQSRTTPAQETGYVIDHSRITAEGLNGKPFYLGRPWRAYSRVVYLHTEMPAELSPDGWMAWPSNTPDSKTPFYAEFDSQGPGARTASRVAWSHQLTRQQAQRFEPKNFLAGKDHWDPQAEAAKLP